MGDVKPPGPAKLFCGLPAADEELLERAEQRLAAEFGPVDSAGDIIPFSFSDYHVSETGEGLLRKLVPGLRKRLLAVQLHRVGHGGDAA